MMAKNAATIPTKTAGVAVEAPLPARQTKGIGFGRFLQIVLCKSFNACDWTPASKLCK